MNDTFFNLGWYIFGFHACLVNGCLIGAPVTLIPKQQYREINLTFRTARDLITFEMDPNWIFKAFPALHCVRYKTSSVSLALIHNRVI